MYNFKLDYDLTNIYDSNLVFFVYHNLVSILEKQPYLFHKLLSVLSLLPEKWEAVVQIIARIRRRKVFKCVVYPETRQDGKYGLTILIERIGFLDRRQDYVM